MKIPASLLFLLIGITGIAFAKDDDVRITPVPADQPIPASDFFRQPLLRDPQLNRAGTHIASIASSDEDKTAVIVYEIATQKVQALGGAGSSDVYWAQWLDDKHVMFSVSTRKMYGLGFMVGELGNLRDAYPVLQYVEAVHLGTPESNRMRPVFWLRQEPSSGGRYDEGGIAAVKAEVRSSIGLVNLVSAGADYRDFASVLENNDRHLERLHPSPKEGMPVGFMLDREGKLAFGFTQNNGVETLHRWNGKDWGKVPLDLDKHDVLTHSDEPGELIIRGERTLGKPRPVQVFDTNTMTVKGDMIADKAYDFDGWFFRDPTTQIIVGAAYDRDGPAVLWFDEGYKVIQKALDGMFPGMVVRIFGADAARKIFMISVFSDKQPAIYHFVDLEKRTVGLLKNSRPWIDPKRMRGMNILKFKTRDGKTLDAYLTLPEGASKTSPVPMIVLPHGGPWLRDRWGFDSEAQFLASRGYAVLQPNYRGSTGYSWQFPISDEWDFVKMHEDVTDAVKTALKSGLINSDKLAIMGASFGGYLALAGVTSEPDMYKCAVSNVGVFDWAQMIKDAKYDRYENPRFALLMRNLGDPTKAGEKFTAMSPINFVNKIKVPVFVAHGKEDNNVSVVQSRRLISQLKKHDKAYETMLVAEEGHGMAKLDNRVEFYERAEAFIRKNLGLPALSQPTK